MTLFSKKYQHKPKPIIGDKLTFQQCCRLNQTAAMLSEVTDDANQEYTYPNPLDRHRVPRLVLVRY